MWCAITKLCANSSGENNGGSGGACASGVVNYTDGTMNRTSDLQRRMEHQDTYDTTQSKQRASVRWLLAKAFNNRVPENLREPFYRDHESQEHLKPQIVRALANAELYCLALGHMYSDPNYHNLNFTTILQTMSRKGVFEPDAAPHITETVLIQTNPLRMNAHMAVIESLMTLYAKEVASGDQISAALQRINTDRGTPNPSQETFTDAESGLLSWVNSACCALRKRIESDSSKPCPSLPEVTSLRYLSDGVALAALVSFYCPDELPWTELEISQHPTLSESIHNLTLVVEFCQRNLPPCTVFHMMPEDITYMRGPMKQNLIVFLADLFNVLEIHPVKCVRGLDRPSSVPRNTTFNTNLKKSNVYQSVSEFSEDSLFRRDSEDNFVVHRSKGVPTLSSVISTEEPLLPARLRTAKEKQNNDSKAEERGDSKQVAAGRPSNWEDSRKTSFAGRRSRRNSFSEDSQLTIENFGGSQENINFIGRNPDKEFAVHSGRKISLPEPSVPTRSSLQDARGSIQLSYDEFEKQDVEKEKFNHISDRSVSKPITKEEIYARDMTDGEIDSKMASFAEISKLGDQKGIHIVYMQDGSNAVPSKSSLAKSNGTGEKKTTTFAALPNTTTWQQQSSSQQQMQAGGPSQDDNGIAGNSGNPMTSQLNNIRMKLEEKRRHIENEKRRMEAIKNKQRQKVGKAAFLQAVSKEISEDVQNTEHKWLNSERDVPFIETRKTPDIENMDMEQYQQSLTMMNNSLHDIQADIQRLATQQNQIQQQNLLSQMHQQSMAAQQQQMQHYASQHNIAQQQHRQSLSQQHNVSSPNIAAVNQMFNMSPQTSPQVQNEQFYLHEQPQRRTWTQSQPVPIQQQPLMRSTGQLGGGGDMRTWGTKPQTYSQQHLQERYQNGSSDPVVPNATNHLSYTINPSPPQRNVHRQISQLMSDPTGPVNLKQMEHQDRTLNRISSVIHAPVPTPPVDDMEPQNISFIGNSEDAALSEGLNRLHITSGSKTYRIPSPTRPLISRNAFQYQQQQPVRYSQPPPETLQPDSSSPDTNEKGFYISFDNEQPKRPKPPLRVKRGSPKKEKSGLEDDFAPRRPDRGYDLDDSRHREVAERVQMQERERTKVREAPTVSVIESRVNREKSPSAIIIGSEPDPNSLDEMEKKKERILLLSLQRRQQQEEAKARKEAEFSARREREKAKEEERARKKEEQAQRRAAILEQYKLKKAIDEAEREGKVLDRSELMNSMKPTPKLRGKTTGRPRPKTIHVATGSVELAEAMLTPSRGKQGSTSNLTSTNSYNPSSMRRDYYRGSHDSLADTGMSSGGSLYRDSESGQARGRTKYPTFKAGGGRKSNSMMNLCGSSSEQDSMVYRYGDTDSGLGRATPPRRAPSPGMGPMRHLPSPSGPGSLPPGLMTKRRIFDDGCSDVSSTPSSMMDYSGPRLYKQPTTKSNRGIMLNAVEYCVFPGVVNKEAKRRVLEEIARSESKHFLILFRDAGCQFRALYSYCPEREDVSKLYGTGPKQVNDRMFDKFFKYNSGGKCFSQVHTKHLTVTIDAFTIHNSLWQGKKVNLPNKKDMALVI